MVNSSYDMHPKFRGISGWIKGWIVNGHMIKQEQENVHCEI